MKRIILILLLISLIGAVSAVAPVASLTSNETTVVSGGAVQFNDTSTNTPTGWAWYFGDENMTPAIWKLQNTTPTGLPSVTEIQMVSLSDGTIIATFSSGGAAINQTWKSDNAGVTWSVVNASPGWCGRDYPNLVSLPDDTLVFFGGGDGTVGYFNDTWRSTNKGVTWTRTLASSGFQPYSVGSASVTKDGSIIMMMGYNPTKGVPGYDQIWKSSDKGSSWSMINGSAGIAADYSYGYSRMTTLTDGTLMLLPGYGTSNVWTSYDGGYIWKKVNSSAFPSSYSPGLVGLPDNSVIKTGGLGNSTWRSVDRGITWSVLNASDTMISTGYMYAVALPNGDVITRSYAEKTIYKLSTASSNARNATHTYTGTNGQTLNVSFQAYNSGGYNLTQKANYITIGSSVIMPIVQWITDKTTVLFPGKIIVNDTSLNTPTMWNYSMGDGKWKNFTAASDANFTYQYVKRGVWIANLTASNSAGVNASVYTNKTIRVIGYQGFELPENPTIWDQLNFLFRQLVDLIYCIFSGTICGSNQAQVLEA